MRRKAGILLPTEVRVLDVIREIPGLTASQLAQRLEPMSQANVYRLLRVFQQTNRVRLDLSSRTYHLTDTAPSSKASAQLDNSLKPRRPRGRPPKIAQSDIHSNRVSLTDKTQASRTTEHPDDQFTCNGKAHAQQHSEQLTTNVIQTQQSQDCLNCQDSQAEIERLQSTIQTITESYEARLKNADRALADIRKELLWAVNESSKSGPACIAAINRALEIKP